jgi:NADH dehydrogenase/NADH:ubiquinone oxidoreductase subunit G
VITSVNLSKIIGILEDKEKKLNEFKGKESNLSG